jgi:hypothetical protein
MGMVLLVFWLAPLLYLTAHTGLAREAPVIALARQDIVALNQGHLVAYYPYGNALSVAAQYRAARAIYWYV